MQAAVSIDDYASSMFRFERLNDGWIDRCASYLRHIFGSALEGKTVIDYAFGRGNWSVAALRAGAAKVIAIDASHSNTERFGKYCAMHKLSAVEVICGNVLDGPVAARGDILWLYGILPAIADQPPFLKEVLKLVPSGDALVLAYGYDKGSLREWLVERCRALLQYKSEADFRRDSLKFTPAARLRARDDLTAPHVNWHTAHGMAELFAPLGFHPVKQVEDFRIVDMGYGGDEFAPVHLLFARGKKAIVLKEPERALSDDILVLDSLWQALLPLLDAPARKDLAITAFNTHFSHMGPRGEAEASLEQLALLLLYGLSLREAKPAGLAAQVLALGNAALADAPRPALIRVPHSRIVRHWIKHTIRI